MKWYLTMFLGLVILVHVSLVNSNKGDLRGLPNGSNTRHNPLIETPVPQNARKGLTSSRDDIADDEGGEDEDYGEGDFDGDYDGDNEEENDVDFMGDMYKDFEKMEYDMAHDWDNDGDADEPKEIRGPPKKGWEDIESSESSEEPDEGAIQTEEEEEDDDDAEWKTSH